MVTMNQLMTGLTNYIDDEIIPHLDGIKRYGVSVYVALAVDGIRNKADELIKHPAIRMLNIVDDDGNIDLDRLHTAMIGQTRNGEKLQVDLPFIGRFSFSRNDIDRICEEIRRA